MKETLSRSRIHEKNAVLFPLKRFTLEQTNDDEANEKKLKYLKYTNTMNSIHQFTFRKKMQIWEIMSTLFGNIF